MKPFGTLFGLLGASSDLHSGTRSDRAIAESLARAMHASGFDAGTELRFLVYHGTVILQGHLDDGIARAALVASIASADGVRRVIDRMTPEFAQSAVDGRRRAA